MPKGKKIKKIGLMKDELGGKIIIDDGSEDKKAKGTKKCVMKRKLKYRNYKNCLGATQLENKTKLSRKK